MNQPKRQHKQVLAWVNRIRALLKEKPIKKLKKGKLANGCDCPIRNSLGRPIKKVTYRYMTFRSVDTAFEIGNKIGRTSWTDGDVELPEYIGKFVDSFDMGLYPELEK